MRSVEVEVKNVNSLFRDESMISRSPRKLRRKKTEKDQVFNSCFYWPSSGQLIPWFFQVFLWRTERVCISSAAIFFFFGGGGG